MARTETRISIDQTRMSPFNRPIPVVGLGNQSRRQHRERGASAVCASGERPSIPEAERMELDDQSTTIPRPLPPLGGHFPRHLKMTLILPESTQVSTPVTTRCAYGG